MNRLSCKLRAALFFDTLEGTATADIVLARISSEGQGPWPLRYPRAVPRLFIGVSAGALRLSPSWKRLGAHASLAPALLLDAVQ